MMMNKIPVLALATICLSFLGMSVGFPSGGQLGGLTTSANNAELNELIGFNEGDGQIPVINTDIGNVGGQHKNILNVGGLHLTGGKSLFNNGEGVVPFMGINNPVASTNPISTNTDAHNIGGIHQVENKVGGIWQ